MYVYLCVCIYIYAYHSLAFPLAGPVRRLGEALRRTAVTSSFVAANHMV